MTTTVRPGQCVFTAPQLARRWACKVDVIRSLIAAGKLKAFSIGRPGSTRPRWRIGLDEVARFENYGPSRPAVKPIRRQRRAATERIRFFQE